MRLRILFYAGVVCLLAFAEARGDDLVKWDFRDGQPGAWGVGGLQVIKGTSPGLHCVTGDDPQMSVALPEDIVIPAERPIRVRMAVNGGTTAQLFWGAMPHEIDSMRVSVVADGKLHDYEFRAPWDLPVQHLRFDPIEAGRAALHIESITVPTAPAREVLARTLYWDHTAPRAGRRERLTLALENKGKDEAACTARVVVPGGLKLFGTPRRSVTLAKGEIREVVWELESPGPGTNEVKVMLSRPGEAEAALAIAAAFGEAKPVKKADYVPEPKAAKTDYLIGAHYFPGWKEGTHYGWKKIVPFPDRKPLLGWYDEGDPEVADWEIKWALEHGLSFFIYCWYRPKDNLGKPVTVETQYLSHGIHEGLLRARYVKKFKFCIMWENANAAGVSSMDDLMKNLLPFWMKNYFTHPSYLTIDGRPVLFVYYFQTFCNQLGKTPEAVTKSVDVIREAFRKNGFKGVWLMAEHRGAGSHPAKKYGFDYVFPYCGARGFESVLGRKDLETPFIPTVSMGWNQEPWGRGRGGWRATPGAFKDMLEKTKAAMDSLPTEHLGRRMLALDNWNEWGEGHYIAPHREYGFGYLDAVRAVFCPGAGEHEDIVPEDVGLGPYDSLFRGKK